MNPIFDLNRNIGYAKRFIVYEIVNRLRENIEKDLLKHWQMAYAVVHIEMIQDGSVILSGYQNSYLHSNYQSHNFIFLILVTPFDGFHPVSGNRKLGIYKGISGGFTFFTMGVDRISKNIFVAGSNFFDFFGNSGFEDADSLWSGMQANMINYINNHGGSAENYSRKNYVVRPKYADIDLSLRGLKTYQ